MVKKLSLLNHVIQATPRSKDVRVHIDKIKPLHETQHKQLTDSKAWTNESIREYDGARVLPLEQAQGEEKEENAGFDLESHEEEAANGKISKSPHKKSITSSRLMRSCLHAQLRTKMGKTKLTAKKADPPRAPKSATSQHSHPHPPRRRHRWHQSKRNHAIPRLECMIHFI